MQYYNLENFYLSLKKKNTFSIKISHFSTDKVVTLSKTGIIYICYHRNKSSTEALKNYIFLIKIARGNNSILKSGYHFNFFLSSNRAILFVFLFSVFVVLQYMHKQTWNDVRSNNSIFERNNFVPRDIDPREPE